MQSFNTEGIQKQSIHLNCPLLSMTPFDNQNLYALGSDRLVYQISMDTTGDNIKVINHGFESLRSMAPMFVLYEKTVDQLYILDQTSHLNTYKYYP